MKINVVVFCCSLLVSITFSCQPQEESTFSIGFSQCVTDDQWRMSMHREMQRELLFYPELKLEIKDAGGSNETQIKHIREFIDQGVDLLIVSPNEADPVTPMVEQAIEKGIPVITIDRKISSNAYTAFVGANNFEIGEIAGQYAANILSKGDKIIELWGLKGSSPSIGRGEGFGKFIDPDDYEVVNIYTDWSRPDAEQKLSEIIGDHLDVDLIFAHNDRMALGAYQICKNHGIAEEVKFIGIDGLPGNTGGMQAIQDGILDATLLYPTGGEEAIRLAAQILQGRPFEKENILHTTLVNKENVRILKLQSDKILNQQANIERQQKLIIDQLELADAQRNLVYFLSGGILVIFILVVYAFYILRERKRVNRELKIKNEKIMLQQEQILKYSKEAEEANSAKLKFFTNISHEFRTPLTLILGPVEEMLQRGKGIPGEIKSGLELIRKNSYRMLRLINQLMEFRKIENGKMKVNASENDICEFVAEIKEAFVQTANEKDINLEFYNDDIKEKMWFDVNMIDKVIFNLLSNSFKFTPAHGSIRIFVLNKTKEVKIVIEDTGRGMSEEHAKHAFDRFYQGSGYQAQGTGLGLSLSRELIQMHKGSIELQTEMGLGTTFTITLKKGKSHFNESELIDLTTPYKFSGNEYVKQLVEISFEEQEGETPDQKILIIEDNEDLLRFMKSYLSKSYEILSTGDGNKGLILAQEEIPDLILCDLMIEGMDGLQYTKKIKSDFRTSHIPIIILTAKTNDEHKVMGIKAGADQYITKPFNIQYLSESIRTQLKNRQLLKRHFNVSDENEELPDHPHNLDQNFIHKFKKIVQDHLSDSSVTADVLCKEMGMSRIQLYRKVKALIGQSVNDYLNNTRLNLAKKLLNTDATIAEVAYQTGFSSAAYFSTAFKNKFKISPSEYKNKAQQALSD